MSNFEQKNQEISFEEQVGMLLFNKMEKEMKEWEDYWKKFPPESVLTCAYEYAMKSDILFAMEEEELEPHIAIMLLQQDKPLNAVYEWFERCDQSDHMDLIRNCIRDCGKAAWEKFIAENSKEVPKQENENFHDINKKQAEMKGLAAENLIEIVMIFNDMKERMHLLEYQDFSVWKEKFADWADDFEKQYKDTSWTEEAYQEKIYQFTIAKFQLFIQSFVIE